MRHGRRPLQVLALAGAALALVPAAASATTNVCATGETDPTHHVGDSADDAAIWINPANPAASTVIGTDKEVGGGLDVYDLAGHEKFVYPDDRVNNVDLRYNFPLGNQRVTLVGATNRVTRKADFWTVDETDGSLHRIASIDFSPAIAVGRGFALYHSPVSGKYYAFVTNFGNTDQYELDGSSGTLTGKLVRQWSVANPNTEGLVADDERGLVYLAEENVGRIGRYGAEPTDPTTSATVDTTTEVGGHIVQDIKGLAIIYGRGGAGYLLAISQGGNAFHLYDRAGANAYRGEFAIGDCSATMDKVTGMDGIDATNVNLGPAFPDGLFVAQDTQNPGTNQNFKLVPWGAIARPMGLTIDTGFNPRDIGALGSPTPLPTPTPIPDPVPDPTPGPAPGPAPRPTPAGTPATTTPDGSGPTPSEHVVTPVPARVAAVGRFGPRPGVHALVSARTGLRVTKAGTVRVTVRNANAFAVRGSAALHTTGGLRLATGVRFTVAHDRLVTLRLTRRARALLRRGSRRVELALTLRDPSGTVRGAWVPFRLRAAAG